MYSDFYLVKNNVLFRSIVDNGHKFKARVIPESLVDVVLHLGHNQSGHNGYQSICTSGKGMRATDFAILQKLQGMCGPKG